jgi:hypothetical protein
LSVRCWVRLDCNGGFKRWCTMVKMSKLFFLLRDFFVFVIFLNFLTLKVLLKLARNNLLTAVDQSQH